MPLYLTRQPAPSGHPTRYVDGPPILAATHEAAEICCRLCGVLSGVRGQWVLGRLVVTDAPDRVGRVYGIPLSAL